jgi:hypothetical protein
MKVKYFFVILLVAVFAAGAMAKSVNVFKSLNTGTRNDFTSRLGYQFTANTTVDVSHLGRPVNPTVNGGVLQASHTVELWDIATATLVASVVIDANSVKDSLGYAFEALPTPVTISTDPNGYFILSSEVAGDGDGWMTLTYITDTYYDELMTVDYAAYGGGSEMPTAYAVKGRQDAYVSPAFRVIDWEPDLDPDPPFTGIHLTAIPIDMPFKIDGDPDLPLFLVQLL